MPIGQSIEVEKVPAMTLTLNLQRNDSVFKKIQLEPREGQEQGDIVPAPAELEAFSS